MAACLLVLLPASACARDSIFVPAFSANTHLGEPGSVSVGLFSTGTEYYGQVAPLTGLTLRLPAGIVYDSAGFPTCSLETLREFGPIKCPEGSAAGPAGSAQLMVSFGGESHEESAEVLPYLAPGGGVILLVAGHSPVSVELLIEGHYESDVSPYGSKLVMSIPTVSTEPSAPDVSITDLDFSLGTTWEIGEREVSTLTLPSSCFGSVAWDAEAAFNGEASENLGATSTACPSAGARTTTVAVLSASTTTPKEEAPVTYTATVTPTSSGPTPTEIVTFVDDAGFPVCPAQLLTPTAGDSAVASCTTSYDVLGKQVVRARYGGNETYRGSLARPVSVTVSEGGEENPPPPAKHEEPSSPSSSSSSSSSPSTTTTTTSTGPSVVATISSAQIASLLDKQLVPSGKTATIPSLLKHGGLTVPFTALEAGTVLIEWYEAPVGAKVAEHSKAKPLLVASGQTVFAAAGAGKVKITLTGAGRRLLGHTKRLKLETKGVFRPKSGAAVSSVRQIVI